MKRIVLIAALITSSCRSSVGERGLELSCYPNIPAQPVPASAKLWTRLSKTVDSKGTYLRRGPGDGGDKPPRPTELDLTNELKLAPGDYVGLQSYGRWFYGCYPDATGPTSDTLGAVFVDAQRHRLAPAKSGQEQAFPTDPSYNDHQPTDVDQDFAVPANQEVIVRVPARAVKILFSVRDSYFNDNCTANPNDFGVTVFEPNRKSGEPKPISNLSDDDEEPNAILNSASVRELLAGPLPEAKTFAQSPFAANEPDVLPAQWRGNYHKNGWSPDRSFYAGRTGNHWGWDLFAPKGTPLIAPVWPSRMTSFDQPPKPVQPPKKPKSNFGHTAIFAFKNKGANYILVYAHLDRVEGAPRAINAAEIVGYAGCSGLVPSDAVGCGSRFEDGPANGMRNDHVHVGFYSKGATVASDGNACDPSAVLNWKMH